MNLVLVKNLINQYRFTDPKLAELLEQLVDLIEETDKRLRKLE